MTSDRQTVEVGKAERSRASERQTLGDIGRAVSTAAACCLCSVLICHCKQPVHVSICWCRLSISYSWLIDSRSDICCVRRPPRSTQITVGRARLAIDRYTIQSIPQSIDKRSCFYPRDAMLARVIVIATCPSVRPSVTRRYCVKTKKASVMISSPSGSPKTLVCWRQISSPNSKGFPQNGSLKQGSVGKIQQFSSFKRQYLENGSRYGHICI